MAKKKIKKLLKKAAPLIMAGLAAKAMMGRNRGIDTGLTKGKFLHSGSAGRYDPMGSARAKRLMTTNDAYSDQTMPSHLSHTMGNTGPAKKWSGDQTMAPNRNIWLKKGGRVGVGKAKRGFGRALKKGK